MSSLRSLGIALALTCLAASFPSQAQNSNSASERGACFFSNQFENWRAPDDKTILIRVGLSRFYKLDLAASCSGITSPFSHLINRIHGPDVICKPIDWDLAVSDAPGFEHGCIVKSMTRLSPEEVASIPAKFKP